jgi:hypothetical protein
MKYYIHVSGFPVGGFCAYDEAGNVLRLGVPYGQMPKRHKTVEACRKAVEHFYK